MPDQDQQQRFEALLRLHVDALYRTALRLARDPAGAEDLVQEACLRAYRTFAAGTEPGNFRAWIFRILINLHIDQSRRAPLPVAGPDVDDLPAPGPGGAQSFANARLGQDLAAAVDALPRDLRLVVQLVLVEGLSHREAGESLDCPEGTVRSRLSRARQRLRQRLAEHAPDPGVVPFPARKEIGG